MVGPAFRWFGGKANLAKRIIDMFPPHDTYIEVFGGSGAVMLARHVSRSRLDVYNDIDSGLVDFFRLMREGGDRLTEFLRLLKYTPYSREEYYRCRETWNQAPEGSLERIRRWYVCATQCYSGLFGGSWQHALSSNMCTKSWTNKINHRLEIVSERFRYVQVEHLDWADLLPKYDRKGTLFYMDPPYVRSTRTSDGKSGEYDHELTDLDHEALIEAVLGMKGDIIISGYDHPIYYPLEKSGWRTSEWEIQLSSPNAAVTKDRLFRTEKVWYNYDTPNDQQINLFR